MTLNSSIHDIIHLIQKSISRFYLPNHQFNQKTEPGTHSNHLLFLFLVLLILYKNLNFDREFKPELEKH